MGKRPGSRLARVELGPRGVWRDYGRSSVVSGVHSQSDAGGVSGIAHAMSCTPSTTQGDAGGVSGIAHAMSCTPSAAPAPPASMKSVGRPFFLGDVFLAQGCVRRCVSGRPSLGHDYHQTQAGRDEMLANSLLLEFHLECAIRGCSLLPHYVLVPIVVVQWTDAVVWSSLFSFCRCCSCGFCAALPWVSSKL